MSLLDELTDDALGLVPPRAAGASFLDNLSDDELLAPPPPRTWGQTATDVAGTILSAIPGMPRSLTPGEPEYVPPRQLVPRPIDQSFSPGRALDVMPGVPQVREPAPPSPSPILPEWQAYETQVGGLTQRFQGLQTEREAIDAEVEAINQARLSVDSTNPDQIATFNARLDQLRQRMAAFNATLTQAATEGRETDATGAGLRWKEMRARGIPPQVGDVSAPRQLDFTPEPMPTQAAPSAWGAKDQDLWDRYARGVAQGALGATGSMLAFPEAASQLVLGRSTALTRDVAGAGASLEELAQQLSPADPGFADQLAQGFGSMVPFFATGMGTGAAVTRVAAVAPWLGAAAGMVTDAVLEAASEAGAKYRERVAQVGEAQAAKEAGYSFLLNTAVLTLTNKLGGLYEGGRLLRKIVGAVLGEGAEEGIQEIISPVVSGQPINWPNVGTAAAVGGIVGGGMGGLTTFMPGAAGEEIRPPTREDEIRQAQALVGMLPGGYGAVEEQLPAPYARPPLPPGLVGISRPAPAAPVAPELPPYLDEKLRDEGIPNRAQTESPTSGIQVMGPDEVAIDIGAVAPAPETIIPPEPAPPIPQGEPGFTGPIAPEIGPVIPVPTGEIAPAIPVPEAPPGALPPRRPGAVMPAPAPVVPEAPTVPAVATPEPTFAEPIPRQLRGRSQPPDPALAQQLAAQAIPLEDMTGYIRAGRSGELFPWGYTVNYMLDPATNDMVVEYRERVEGEPAGRPRFTARTPEEMAAVHRALGLPPLSEFTYRPRGEKGVRPTHEGGPTTMPGPRDIRPSALFRVEWTNPWTNQREIFSTNLKQDEVDAIKQLIEEKAPGRGDVTVVSAATPETLPLRDTRLRDQETLPPLAPTPEPPRTLRGRAEEPAPVPEAPAAPARALTADEVAAIADVQAGRPPAPLDPTQFGPDVTLERVERLVASREKKLATSHPELADAERRAVAIAWTKRVLAGRERFTQGQAQGRAAMEEKAATARAEAETFLSPADLAEADRRLATYPDSPEYRANFWSRVLRDRGLTPVEPGVRADERTIPLETPLLPGWYRIGNRLHETHGIYAVQLLDNGQAAILTKQRPAPGEAKAWAPAKKRPFTGTVAEVLAEGERRLDKLRARGDIPPRKVAPAAPPAPEPTPEAAAPAPAPGPAPAPVPAEDVRGLRGRPPEPPALTKPLWEMTKAEYDAFIAAGGVVPEEDDVIAGMRIEGPGGLRAAATMDPRLLQVLAGNLYSGDKGMIAVKELVQNAIDAMRGLPGTPLLSVNVKQGDRQIDVVDSGTGMTPEVATEQFMDIGGTLKGEGAAGGFGIAKVAIFGNSEAITVVTTAKRPDGSRVTTTLTGSGADWSDTKKGLAVTVEENVARRQTGTRVSVTLRPSVPFTPYDYQGWLRKFLEVQRLPMGFDIRADGTQLEVRPLETEPIHTLTLPGAELEILATPQKIRDRSVTAAVLNNGIYQFDAYFYTGADTKQDLPAKLIVDVHALAQPDTPNYPFRPDRERLQDAAFTAIQDWVKTDLSGRATRNEIDAVRRAIESSPTIPGTDYRVFDTTQVLPAETVDRLAHDPTVTRIATALGSAMDTLTDELMAGTGGDRVADLGQFVFGGIGLGDGYLGLNIKVSTLLKERDRPNLILVNPYLVVREIERRNMPPSGRPRQAAARMMATVLHEIAHQESRQHDEEFASALTRAIGLTDDVFPRLVHELTTILERKDPRTGRTVYWQLQETLTNELEPHWNESRDVFKELGTFDQARDIFGTPGAGAAREGDAGGAGGGPSAPEEGEGGGPRPSRALRGRGPEPPGALAPSADVGGRGGLAAESPHHRAIRRALQSGQLTPERADQLGHFASYPDLRGVIPQATPPRPTESAAPPLAPTAPTEARAPPTWGPGGEVPRLHEEIAAAEHQIALLEDEPPTESRARQIDLLKEGIARREAEIAALSKPVREYFGDRPAAPEPQAPTPEAQGAAIERVATGILHDWAASEDYERREVARKELTARGLPFYEHAERFGRLTRGFVEHLEADTLPTRPDELRKLAAQLLGVDAKELGTDAALVDDVFDAMETAVNTIYRQRYDPTLTFEGRMEQGRQAEAWIANRTRTLELAKRQQFSTPLPLAEAAAHALDLREGETVMEPTAGTGNLLAPLPNATAVVVNEVDPRRAEGLRLQGYHPTVTDALRAPLRASVALMNPPWGKYSARKYGPPIPMPYGTPVDVAERFVVKAMREIPPGGRVVAVMPTTILQSHAFLHWLERDHTLRALIQSPPGAYDTRGTTVDSILLVVDKGKVDGSPDPIRATPATWADYEAEVRRLGAGGSHARVGGAVTPVDLTPAAQRPDRPQPQLGDRSPSPEAAPEGGAVPARGQPVDGEAGPGQRGVRPGGEEVRPGGPPGAGAGVVSPGVVAVAPRGPGLEPEGTGGVLREGAGGGETGNPVSQPTRPWNIGTERYSVANQDEFRGALDSPIFAPAPLRAAPGLNPHPRLVVKTRSLIGARLPELTVEVRSRYIRQAYDDKLISDAQLDYGILPALQANERGHGFLSAADVGVGKTRIGGAVMAEWLETGTAKRILYITANEQNIENVKAELYELSGQKEFPWTLIDVKDYPEASARYTKGERQAIPIQDRVIYVIDKANLAAFAESLGKLELDAIVGDEAHQFKNIDGDVQVGQAWHAIQKDVLQRNGKFLYLTATPAADFDDLRHFIGLKEWTAESFEDYKRRISGVAAVSESAEEAKARVQTMLVRLREITPPTDEPGMATMRRLEDTYDNIGYNLRPDLRKDAYKDLAHQVQDELEKLPGGAEAMITAGGEKGRRRRSGSPFGSFITPAEMEQVMRELAMKGKYDSVDLWRAGVEFEALLAPPSATQTAEYAELTQFFQDLNAAFRTFAKMNQKDPSGGFGVVAAIQAEAKRRQADYRLDHAIRLAQESLARGEQPVISLIEFRAGKIDKGRIPAAIKMINTRAVEADAEIGEGEEIPEALEKQAELLERWRAMPQVRDAIQTIQDAFGKEHVAVVTGVPSVKQRILAVREFQQGLKKVAVISGAGKTGISLHHIVDTGGGAKGRRHLIVTDYEWSATNFKQELGRVDRSGQLSAPRITALTLGAAGEKKFLSTIANRMRGLGALSKGAAESASHQALIDFELSGTLATMAMRQAFQKLPLADKEWFMSRGFYEYVSHGKGQGEYRVASGQPKADLRTFLLDLQMMPMEVGNRIWDVFWNERQAVIAQHEALAEVFGTTERTHKNEGTILRTTTLRPDLLMHEVQDASGAKFAILQGMITDHMERIVASLPRPKGQILDRPIRKYITFKVGEDQLSGLEIRPGAIRGLADRFGASLHKELHTPAQVLEAVHAGDKVKLHGKDGETWTLRQRQDGRLAIDGVKMKDKEIVLASGGAFVPTGSIWVIASGGGGLETNLGKFLDRFPPHQPAMTPEHATPDEATDTNLRAAGEEGVILNDLVGATVQAVRAVTRHLVDVLGPQGGARTLRGRPTPAPATAPAAVPITAPDPEVERVLTAGRAPQDEIVKALREVRTWFERSFVWEPTLGGPYKLERDEIRVFQATQRRIGDTAAKDVIGVVSQLRVRNNATKSRENLDLFTRIVVLRDLRSRAMQPERFPGGIPGGLDLDQVDDELTRLEGLANDAVRNALDAHTYLMETEAEDLADRGKLSEDRAIADYFPHLVLAYQDRFQRSGAGARRMGQPARPFLYRAKGSEELIEAKDYIGAMFLHRGAVRRANAVDDFALQIIARHDKWDLVPAAERQTLRPGDTYTIGGVEYTVYQYKPGRSTYLAQTVPEAEIAQAIANGESQIDLAGLERRPAVGPFHQRYLLPTPIAKRFENWALTQEKDFSDLMRKATQHWKRFTIGFWGTVGHLMNLTGDLINMTRVDPRAWAQIPAAVRDIAHWKFGEPGALVELLDRYDVLQGGYIGHELGFQNQPLRWAAYPELHDFMTHSSLALSAVKRVWDFALQDIPEYREALPRIALARSLLARVERGESLQREAAGLDIEGLPLEQAAMKIAREAMIDYGKVTPFEQKQLRTLWMPFYLWSAMNASNWIRWAAARPFAAASLLGVRALLEWWNNGDDDRRKVEAAMKPWQRYSPHLVTGMADAKGRPIVIQLPGDPVTDVLNIAGLDRSFARVTEALQGKISLTKAARLTLEDSLLRFETGPVARVMGLLNPFAKLTVEQVSGTQLFPPPARALIPDALKGTTQELRMRGRYVAEQLVRPYREARRILGESESAEGVDWMTSRWGLGLPIVRVDVMQGNAANATRYVKDARDDVLNAALERIRESPGFQRLTARQQEAVLRQAAEKLRGRLRHQLPNPIPGRFWRERALQP